MKHFCGGEVLERTEEEIFYCQRCGKIFMNEEEVEQDNRLNDERAEHETILADEDLNE